MNTLPNGVTHKIIHKLRRFLCLLLLNINYLRCHFFIETTLKILVLGGIFAKKILVLGGIFAKKILVSGGILAKKILVLGGILAK